MWSKYAHNANRKGFVFELDAESFAVLVKRPCYYCGRPPTKPRKDNSCKGAVAHGLDRIDNAKGYTLHNAVPCCSECNYAKGRLGAAEFIKLAHRITNYQLSIGSWGTEWTG
jgi:hypothetical protein